MKSTQAGNVCRQDQDMEKISMGDVINNAKLASNFLKSLANENRLVILCSLAKGEKNVGELEGILDIRQPTLSQQLARLRADKLVTTRRDSKQIFYRLASWEAEETLGLLCELFELGINPRSEGKPSPKAEAGAEAA